jgi:hypothetical protein
MIEAGGNAEPAVDPRIVFCGYIGNSVRFQKGNKLTAADIEKHVPQVAAFFDRYRVGDHRLETQHALVKRAGLVEVEGREADMRKSLVGHVRCSLEFAIPNRTGPRGSFQVAVLVDAVSIGRTMSESRSR